MNTIKCTLIPRTDSNDQTEWSIDLPHYNTVTAYVAVEEHRHHISVEIDHDDVPRTMSFSCPGLWDLGITTRNVGEKAKLEIPIADMLKVLATTRKELIPKILRHVAKLHQDLEVSVKDGGPLLVSRMAYVADSFDKYNDLCGFEDNLTEYDENFADYHHEPVKS